MNEEELFNLISQGEGETLEFKSSFDAEAYESVAAFSNARGGRLLIGVSNSGKINGINYSHEQIKDIINEIKTKTEPYIIPDVYQVSADGRSIFVFEVIEFPLKPVSLRGRYFVRIGSSNHLMSASEVADMHLKTRNTSWDFYPDEDKTIDDLDENKILRAKKMIEDNLELDLGDVMDFLKKYSLVDKKNGKEYPTHAAMLLFSKEPLIDTEIQIGLFQDEITIKKSKLIKTDLISEVEEVMDFIKAYILKEYIITGKPTREERWQYPLDALREFVINAIVHRDYRGVHSQFKVFSNKIVLWNSGWLPLDLTIQDIKSGKDKSVPRNKLIAEIFRDVRVMERYGRGISGAIKHTKDYGLPEPEITEVSGGFEVCIFSKEFTTKKTREETREETMEETMEETREEIIRMIKENPKITMKELANKIGISDKGIEWNIRKLKDSGILKRIGPTKGGHWEIDNAKKS